VIPIMVITIAVTVTVITTIVARGDHRAPGPAWSGGSGRRDSGPGSIEDWCALATGDKHTANSVWLIGMLVS
jgi:hypothetical protein